MSANPHANGGLLRKALGCRIFATTRSSGTPAARRGREHPALGEFLRDVMRDNMTNFRVFGPDENASNRLEAIYEASKKTLAGRHAARGRRRRRAGRPTAA